MPRTCRTRHRPVRDLGAVARQLDAIAEEAGWDGPPMLIGLTDEGVDDMNPPAPVPGSSGTDPADLVASLVGFDAPAEWEAMAVVVQGRSWALDDRSADPRPVRLTHVVDRHGGLASVIRHAGEEPMVRTETGEGRLIDVCRRCLGLTTAPPPSDSTALWALLWLDHLLARAARGERLRGLVAAARAHPGVEMVAEHEPKLVDMAAERLVRIGRMMGEARNWAHLRRAASAGEWPVENLAPDGAAWMDDGMFARWVLAEFPLLDEYLEELDRLLPASTVIAVRAVLAEWDLLDPPGDPASEVS
jgi:hypothetical protein